MSDLDERLTCTFADFFAARRCRFWSGESLGGPGYFGVQVVAITADGSEIEVEVTFRAGHRYCCFESACHFAYYSERGWRGVRECMDRQGLSHLVLPVIRSFRGVIERGAVAQPGLVGNPEAYIVMEGSVYQAGPWHPIVSKPAEPVAGAIR